MAFAALLALAGCGVPGTAARTSSSPSALASSSPSSEPSPEPSPEASPTPSPLPSAGITAVPTWAAKKASCTGSASPHEALIVLQGTTSPRLADVSDPLQPRTICTFTGTAWQPQLVTQGLVSWSATQTPAAPGPSVIVALSLFTSTSAVVARWQGGGFMDGLHTWSPDLSSIIYVTSDATAVHLHQLSGGGDRLVATLGAVPARGLNPGEDDAFLGFSPDGQYFAFVQTVTSTGDHLQIRRTADGGLAYSQANATMAAWGSAASKLYFRQQGTSTINVWDPKAGVTQAFAQKAAWIRPATDVGDDYLAFTVRDSAGIPHAWLYGHGGQAGGELANVRSTPSFLNAASVFLVEEAPCGSNCGIGPATQPDGKTFVYNIGTQTETASTIASNLGAWPRLGQG